MIKLIRYNLSLDPTLQYVKKTLDNANTLSSVLLKLIDFDEGNFFTLLPEKSNIERLYEFESGIVLPQNPEQKYASDETKATFATIPTIKNELSELIMQNININNKLSCIIDDVIRYATDKFHMELFNEHGLSYGKEVYYLLKNKEISSKLILRCLEKSSSFWHSLIILTLSDFNNYTGQILSLEKIKEVCRKSTAIIVEAYDAEGYVFWEKKGSKLTWPT